MYSRMRLKTKCISELKRQEKETSFQHSFKIPVCFKRRFISYMDYTGHMGDDCDINLQVQGVHKRISGF
jgi:hypothetical protein